MSAPQADENTYQQYVCHGGNFLCPIIAGEPLSRCAGACYSKFMYSCSRRRTLELLPAVESPFSLTASNPQVPQINNQPVSACGGKIWIGGSTCSYCPDVVPRDQCPPGTSTVFYASSALAVKVPGGQQYYLDPFWKVGYTQAHSAYIPPGSTVGGFAAYKTGGFVNLNGGGWGWVACPPTDDNPGRWSLVARNETNAAGLSACKAVNLKVTELPQGTFGAWQYA